MSTMRSEIMVITPDMATKMLEKNNNRKVNPNWVEALAESMKNGRFLLSPDGIAFDKTGALINGQHRLLAVIKSGCNVRMYVTRNCDVEAIGVIDQGTRRTMAHHMQMFGEDDIILKSSAIIGAFSGILRKRLGRAAYQSLSNSDKAEILNRNKNIARMIYYATVTKRMSFFNANMRAALLESVLVTGDYEALIDFRNAYELNADSTNPKFNSKIATKLRIRIADEHATKKTTNEADMYTLVQAAFDAFRTGRNVMKLKARDNDLYVVSVNKFMNGDYDKLFDGMNFSEDSNNG